MGGGKGEAGLIEDDGYFEGLGQSHSSRAGHLAALLVAEARPPSGHSQTIISRDEEGAPSAPRTNGRAWPLRAGGRPCAKSSAWSPQH